MVPVDKPKRTKKTPVRLRAAEFFAGIGLVRAAIEREGFNVVFANDIDASKHAMYAANFDAEHFVLGDVRKITGAEVPAIDLATASFPCTDISLAGARAGLAGPASGMFWEFARILREMGKRRPRAVLLENVMGFATSHGGQDIVSVIKCMNDLGYSCDLLTVDARWFLPQSRQRLFIIGTRGVRFGQRDQWQVSDIRPRWICDFAKTRVDLAMHMLPLPTLPRASSTLANHVERLSPSDERWWSSARLRNFVDAMSPLHQERLAQLRVSDTLTWVTAYRRTRDKRAVWEIRPDTISGCLRTARGGSSKQALVQAGCGSIQVRWMTSREYARLQGAPNFNLAGARDSAAISGFGDAVCVPVIEWLARHALRPSLLK